ncbi:GNAT family N-acetyltransferase [Nocardia asteroides]|uniref:GNAT family N-acetyltransferase n=1 Tax=Nocardia asteroides TaxID=1824 RepID=UPI001E5CCE80|nr:GNAT family N-acetyltransferase [Nocardia asteroides]UGT53168.1 GNAT family N-acetyltransferase [Nocardia asteroides]
MTWISTAITVDHKLSEFDCGKPVLDEWLQRMALQAEQRWTSRTYVWITEDDPTVRAYYAIAPTQVERDVDGLSQKLSSGLKVVPAFLLAKFALDRSLHGQGLGEQLLVDAVSKILGAAQTTGGRLIVVDAIDESAAAFYSRFGFVRVTNTENRLVMKTSTALSAFGVR